MSTVASANQSTVPSTGTMAAGKNATSSIAIPPEPGTAAKTASPAAGAEPKSPGRSLSNAELTSQLQALQAKMDRLNPALDFVLDESSGRALIQLTDRATKEVIQQFPAEAALQFAKALDRLDKGHLVHKTV